MCNGVHMCSIVQTGGGAPVLVTGLSARALLTSAHPRPHARGSPVAGSWRKVLVRRRVPGVLA
jgi:hypothetical protein